MSLKEKIKDDIKQAMRDKNESRLGTLRMLSAAIQRREVDERIQHLIERWKHEMEALGAEVKGVWLVDFDNGSGYYCWRWPETTVDHFHGYDEGFGGRSRIQ